MKLNKRNIVPVIIALAVYLLCYQLPKIIYDPNQCNILMIPIDKYINLHTQSVYIYIGAYIQWILITLYLMKEDENIVYRFASTVIFGSLIGFTIFMIYPTITIRQEITGNTFADFLLMIIYDKDNLINAFPSFHCFISTLCVIALFKCENRNNLFICINTIFSILVYLSTIYTKQHLVLDIPGGVLLAILSYHLTNRFNLNVIFRNINNSLKIK